MPAQPEIIYTFSLVATRKPLFSIYFVVSVRTHRGERVSVRCSFLTLQFHTFRVSTRCIRRIIIITLHVPRTMGYVFFCA